MESTCVCGDARVTPCHVSGFEAVCDADGKTGGIMHKISAHKFSAEDEQQGRQAVVRHGQATRHAARRINRPGPV